MHTDPIADMLTRIRNAVQRRAYDLELPHSRLKAEVAGLLVAQGYLEESVATTTDAGRKMLKLTLRYIGDHSAIEGIKSISKPGQRIYENATKLNRFMTIHTGDIVISTTKGLMTGREATRAGLGGEVLFRIW